MKNYRNMLLAALLMLTQWALAATISPEQARQQAAQFLNRQAALSRGKQAQKAQPALQLVIETPQLYGFNVGTKGQGFVIVSGDDHSVPILGYADEGSLDENAMPPAMKAWLNNYRHELQNGALRSPKKAVANREAIEPLLKSEWNQTGRYNALCPVFNGEHSVTGCVATAMAQIMNYYRWPEKTTDTIPGYTTQSFKLTVDSLPPVAFDWKSMDDAQSDEVAKLMLYGGASVHMDYSPYSSGSAFHMVSPSLVHYFGYDPSIRRMVRAFFGIDQWEESIYEELAQQRPVFYAGQTYAGEGHAFVCDGYDGDGLFHINWGWGGFGNGYFLLSACDAQTGGTGGASTSSGFSLEQEIVLGIMPLQETTEPKTVRLAARAFELRCDTVISRESAGAYFSGVKVYYEQFSANVETHSFYYGIGLYQNGKLVKTLMQSAPRELPPNTFMYATVNLNLQDVANGDYDILLISRESTESEWLPSEGSELRHITAHIEDTKLTLKQYPDMQLKVRKLDYPKGRRPNNSNEWIATIENKGAEYNGGLWVIVDGNIVAGNGTYLRSGEMGEVKFLMMPADEVQICTDREGKNVIYKGPDVMESLSDLSLNTFELTSTPSVKAGSEVEAKVNVCRGTDIIKSYKLAYQIDELPLEAIERVPSLEEHEAATCYFSFTAPATLATGHHSLTLYITHINGQELPETDKQLQRQELSFTIYREGLGRQKVFVGHFTRTGAGYGSIMDQALYEVRDLRSDDYTIVSTHINDDLACMDDFAFMEYAQLVTSTLPDITYDRYALPGQNELYRQGKFVSKGEEISQKIDEMLQLPAFATLDLKARMLPNNRIELTVKGLAANELKTLVGDVNLTVMLAEDSVQSPQYDGQGGYITDYQHMNVLREVLTPVWGSTVKWNDDNEFTTTFTFNISSEWNYRNMKAVAMLGKPFTGNNFSELHLVNCNDLSFADLELNPFEFTGEKQMILAYQHGEEYNEQGRGMASPGTYKAAYMMTSTQTEPLAGNQITHLRFALASDKVNDVKVFVSSHLDSLYDYSQEVAQIKQGWNIVKLREPFTITADTLFVGYEFCDDMGGTQAIAYSNGQFVREPGSYIFGTSDGKWRDLSDDYGCLAIQAIAAGDQLPDTDLRSIALTTDSRYYANQQAISGQVTLVNSGKNTLGSTCYEAYIDDEKYLENGISEDIGILPGAQYQRYFNVDLSSGNLQTGLHTLKLVPTIENQFHADDTISVDFYIYKDSLPRQKTLVEYATATWVPDYMEACQLMDTLKAAHNDVAVIALHQGDALTTGESTELTAGLQAIAPSVVFNRTAINGTKKPVLFATDNLEKGYSMAASQPAFATVELAAAEQNGKLKLTVSGKTVDDFPQLMPQAMLNIVLTEDSIDADELFHNDVLRTCVTDTWGDSLQVSDDQSYSMTYEIETDAEWNPANLHVVAFISRPLIDGDCSQLDVINSEAAPLQQLLEASGIAPLHANDGINGVQQYTLDGRRVESTRRGITIVRRTDGTIRKQIMK